MVTVVLSCIVVLTVVLDPLSDTAVSGTPCSANTNLRWLINVAYVVDFSLLTMEYLL